MRPSRPFGQFASTNQLLLGFDQACPPPNRLEFLQLKAGANLDIPCKPNLHERLLLELFPEGCPSTLTAYQLLMRKGELLCRAGPMGGGRGPL